MRTCARRDVDVPADGLWHAAESVLVRHCRLLGPLVRWRIPGVPDDITYRDLFRRYPFTVLGEGRHWSLSGLAGRIWTLRRDYPRLDGPEEWRAWDEPGTVRVLFAHWVQSEGAGSSTLVSDVRIGAVDRDGRRGLRRVRGLIATSQRLIGHEALAVAERRAREGADGR